MGYLFQNYALFPNMTVEQNIRCGLCREKGRGRREDALRGVTAMLRLQGLEKRRPAQLSGGQAQRVALARILVNRPRLLMFEEPFEMILQFLWAGQEPDSDPVWRHFPKDRKPNPLPGELGFDPVNYCRCTGKTGNRFCWFDWRNETMPENTAPIAARVPLPDRLRSSFAGQTSLGKAYIRMLTADIHAVQNMMPLDGAGGEEVQREHKKNFDS